MKIEFVKECGDHSDPCIDIFPTTEEEAFTLGKIAEKIYQSDLCAWEGGAWLRIPLVQRKENGLAITYKEKKVK